MPTYNPVGISMRLGAVDLSKTVTPIEKRKENAAESRDISERALRESDPLQEENVSLPGDGNDYNLKFLQNVPFLQVQACADAIWGQSRGRKQPKALALHVELSEKTFKACSAPDKEPHRLMIDVLFNGTLASSVAINLRDIRGFRAGKSLHQIFSGARTSISTERPWILLPPGQPVERHIDNQDGTAWQRWERLSAALVREADQRGYDDWGERPPSADYLAMLAMTCMPDAVKSLQGPGSSTFGVIDVIVTAGTCEKSSQYIKEPERLLDPRYKHVTVPQRKKHDTVRPSGGPMDVSEQDADVHIDPQLRGGTLIGNFQGPFPQHSANTPLHTSGLLGSENLCTPSQAYPEMTPVYPNDVTVNPKEVERPSITGLPTINPNMYPARLMGHPDFSPGMNGTLPQMAPMRRAEDFALELPGSSSPYQGGPNAHAFVEPTPPPQTRFPYLRPVQHSGPLPAVANWPLPKPKIPVDPQLVDSYPPRPSILLSRLVITGKDGAVVIDHWWEVPQRIYIGKKSRKIPAGGLRNIRAPKNAVERRETRTQARQQLPEPALLETPPPTSPARVEMEEGAMSDQKASIIEEVEDAHTDKLMTKSTPLSSRDTQDATALVGNLERNDNVALTAPASRIAPVATYKPMIQGGKAVTYIYDNPEDILREWKSTRRQKRSEGEKHSTTDSRGTKATRADPPMENAVITAPVFGVVSTAGPSDTLVAAAVPPPYNMVEHAVVVAAALTTTDPQSSQQRDAPLSSPLSSALGTPEIMAVQHQGGRTAQNTIPVISPCNQKNTVRDPVFSHLIHTPADMRAVSASQRNESTAMNRLAATQTPQASAGGDAPVTSAALAASASIPLDPRLQEQSRSQVNANTTTSNTATAPNTGKRKRRSSPAVVIHSKPSTSPEAKEDLSKDCIIRYADNGVVRNVRCEKKGTFSEDMVVVGMRFYVPGV